MNIRSSVFALSLAAGMALVASVAVAAGTGSSGGSSGGTSTAPTVPVQCQGLAPGSAKYRKCLRRYGSSMKDEDIYSLGQQLAKAGHFEDSLEVLDMARNQNDVRVLTMIGYSTRKMGDIEGGMVYYTKALGIDPNAVDTREYLGEAFLQKKDLSSAKAQLGEIKARCGVTCEPYVDLDKEIKAFEAGL